MKRAAVAGVRRGPPALQRQRRTLRMMQTLLVLLGATFFVAAGYTWGRAAGFDAATGSGVAQPRKPGTAQIVVLCVFGGLAIAGALSLQSRGGLRMPVPARLDELAGRAEDVAVTKAEQAAKED